MFALVFCSSLIGYSAKKVTVVIKDFNYFTQYQQENGWVIS
jgi:phosphoribosylpyrophosphate synthetase